MNQHLKLKEIIWEICGKCLNGCSYCGSKEGWNEEIDEVTIKKIAEAICEYDGIEQINISGGDPLLVSYDMHKDITEAFKKKNIKCKIIVNPKSIIKDTLQILKLYSVIGVSVNVKSEINLANSLDFPTFEDNTTTFITNFNIGNVFLYDEIEKIVKKYNTNWQIQYTVYRDPEDERAIYNNDEALKHLKDKIKNSIKNGIKIIIADNANSGKCTAGLYSIGISSDGSILPCLSSKAWRKSVDEEYSEGNICKTPLKDIWEQEFKDQRFGELVSCKDFCKNKKLDCDLFENPLMREEIHKMIDEAIDKKMPIPFVTWPSDNPNKPITVYYGVYAYAVWSDSDPNYTITSTSDGTLFDIVESIQYTIYGKDGKVKK